ncbi:hypothetical protein MOSE0_E03466 [Monosporozyma servazzii]
MSSKDTIQNSTVANINRSYINNNNNNNDTPFTSKFNYNSYSKPFSSQNNQHHHHQHTINNSNSSIMIEIDNLPPNKNWKQIKYLIGGIIHHSNVIQIRLIPPMTSYLPPFVTIQSCIVVLQNTLSNEMIDDLISTLNSYTWENFDLYAYLIPNPFNTNNNNNINNALNIPFPNILPPPIYIPNQFINPYNNNNNSPLTPDSTSQSPLPNINIDTDNSPMYQQQQPPPFVPMLSPSSPQQQPTMIMSPHIPRMVPTPNIPFPSPYFPKQQQQAHYREFVPAVSFKTKYGGAAAAAVAPTTSFTQGNVITGYKRRYSNNQFINPLDMKNEIKENLQESYHSIDNDLQLPPPPFYYPNQARFNPINKRNANPFKQPNKLKNIFNEINFRKQMTERGMWQLKINNFPPYLLPETETLITNLNDEKIDIHTDTIEKFGKLRWTILKDFIKLKCPNLLNLKGQFNESINNNTREFYVGVYEAEETKLIVDIKPGIKKNNHDIEEEEEEEEEVERQEQGSFGSNKTVEMEAILYNAIIGFHHKDLADMCLESLQNQEYSLGYKLNVEILPPYEDCTKEEQDKSKVEFQQKQNDEQEEEENETVQGFNNLTISNHNDP